MRHARRGFTLIELLMVIGIIMILVGLLIVGYRHINATAARRETIAELHICRGMQQEYENRSGLQGIEYYGSAQAADPSGPATTPTSLAGFPIYIDPWSSLNTITTASVSSNTLTYKPGAGAGTYWPCLRFDSSYDDIGLPATGNTLPPSDSDMGDKSSAGTPRYISYAVQYTDEVMYLLAQIPANRTTMQSLQSKRILELPTGKTQWMAQGGSVMTYPPVVPLDGWGNPIIFVPRGGIHVTIKDPSQPSGSTPNVYLVRSTGTVLIGPEGSSNQDPPMTGNERPFWASAGQDGDFTTGEDNIYSFQD